MVKSCIRVVTTAAVVTVTQVKPRGQGHAPGRQRDHF